MPACARLVTVLLLAALALPGCGSGGGGGGGGGGKPGSGKNFKVTAGPSGGKIAGLNVPVALQFNKDVDPDTVSGSTIQVLTIDDPAGQATAPGGIQASLQFEVSGKTVLLVPTVEFQPDKVAYGFKADALYEIAFTDPDTGSSVQSVDDQPLANAGTTYFFRTPSVGFDFNAGFPHAKAYLVPDPDAAVLPDLITDAGSDGEVVDDAVALFAGAVEIEQTTPTMTVPGSPTQPILFFFNDACQPQSIINPVDGSSPSINISINTAPLPEFLPKTLTAEYTFVHQQGDLTIVQWTPGFGVYPPGAFLFVKVDATVLDLGGNSKADSSSDADIFVALKVLGTVDPTVYAVTEPFDDSTHEDATATSAEWATDFPGQLGPVLGGGTGADGPFFVDVNGTADDPGKTVLPPGAVIDYDEQLVSLPVVDQVASGVFEPRPWQFSSFMLPLGWTLRILMDADGDGDLDPDGFVVQSPGHPLDGLGGPLVIRCSGELVVFGTIDVAGVDAAVCVRPENSSDPEYPNYLGQGGDGAVALLAAGNGGDGGDVLMLKSDDAIALDLVSPPATPAFQTADPKLRGATGRSTSLSATVLHDGNVQLSSLDNDPGTVAVGDAGLLASIAAGEMLVQPNLGVGSSLLGNAGTANEDIDENHPTYVVAEVSVTGAGTDITVSTAPGAPTLTQPSDNIGAAPVSSAGDCYLVGRLRGHDGADITSLQRGGVGAQPYVVVNEGALGVSTTGGGGGGGGGVDAGSDGLDDGPASDPFVNQRGGSGGISLDESPGAAGGLGSVRGTAMVLDGEHMSVVTQTAGRDVAELAGAALVGSFLIPDSSANGWMFAISAFDGTTFTLERIQLDVLDIGLLEGPGVDGPGLGVGNTYDFLVVPRLEIGGGGGGGSGVSVTGTVNNSAIVLPTLAPGAAGGSGGGSVTIESARKLSLGASADVRANGGAGGTVFDQQTFFAGGGGGGGGNVLLRAGRELETFLGAKASVEGGVGGGVPGTGMGGQGGPGFLRIEDFDDTLDAADVLSFTFPTAAEANVGRELGLPQGVGQSVFYQAEVVNPEWDRVEVDYLTDTNSDDVLEACTWSFDDHGADGGAQGYLDPPVKLLFNTNGTDDDGFFDGQATSVSFYPACDLVSARTGLAWDSLNGVLLYAPGESCTRVHRLDPATLAPVASGSKFILLPTIPSAISDKINVVSLAACAVPGEIFLLERATHRVHVLDLATGAFKRTITLPLDLQGAMTYDPATDLLLFADNEGNRVVTFKPRDAAAATPETTDYAPLSPVSVFPLTRDGTLLDIHVVGMAVDVALSALWCTDAQSGTLFQVSLLPGFEGESVTGINGFSALTSGGQGVLPSAVAFDGSKLYLIHATDPADSRVQSLLPSAVSTAGADLVLAGFGTLLPEEPLSIADGDIFLRFRLILDGVHDAGATSFRDVRAEQVDFDYVNKPY